MAMAIMQATLTEAYVGCHSHIVYDILYWPLATYCIVYSTMVLYSLQYHGTVLTGSVTYIGHPAHFAEKNIRYVPYMYTAAQLPGWQ